MEGVRKGERERAREGRGGEVVSKEGQELEREGGERGRGREEAGEGGVGGRGPSGWAATGRGKSRRLGREERERQGQGEEGGKPLTQRRGHNRGREYPREGREGRGGGKRQGGGHQRGIREGRD